MQMSSKIFWIRKFLKHLNSATIFFIFPCLTTESLLLIFLLLSFFQSKVFNCLNVTESTCLTISICISTGSLLQYVPLRQALNSSPLCLSGRFSLISAKSPGWKKRIKQFYFNSKTMNLIYLTRNSPSRQISHFDRVNRWNEASFQLAEGRNQWNKNKKKKHYKKREGTNSVARRHWREKEIAGGKARD